MTSLLIDTSVAINLLGTHRVALPSAVVETIADERNHVALSAVSVFEMAVKRSIGKLTLPNGWADVLRRLPFDPLPVTAVHAERVEHLPWHHKDPFDRLLIAQAQVERMTVVTADGAFDAYDVETLWELSGSSRPWSAPSW